MGITAAAAAAFSQKEWTLCCRIDLFPPPAATAWPILAQSVMDGWRIAIISLFWYSSAIPNDGQGLLQCNRPPVGSSPFGSTLNWADLITGIGAYFHK